MRADLYICNDTFSHNGRDGVKEVRGKLAEFQLMLDKVRQYEEENVLYLVKEEFGPTVLFEDGKSINDILANYESSVEKYGKDVYTFLTGIFKHCKNTPVSIADMKEYLTVDDKDNCSAILVLNPLEGYEKHVQVLSSVGGWLQFRRNFLAKYPGDEHFFIEESKKYYPDLLIHESSETTLKDVIESHPRQIVAYLSALNDCLIADFKEFGGGDLNAFLPWFAVKHCLDGASFEGKKDEKFRFTFPDGTEAYCEPHLKMYKDDAGNQNQHCRIHFKSPKDGEKIVYVGCICKHL